MAQKKPGWFLRLLGAKKTAVDPGPTAAPTVGRASTPAVTVLAGREPWPAAAGPVAGEVLLEWSVGQVILGLYEVKPIREGVEQPYTEGGMGRVYRVHHKGWNLDLAAKVPRGEAFGTEGQRQNFTRECETWADLGLHPHIVSCHYVRRLGRVPVVFAEFVEGGSLKDWMESKKLYAGGADGALERILDIAIQFAWGLHYAHEKGLVHQDVKPANVMLTPPPEGLAKVTDFGLARARAAAGQTTSLGGGRSVLVSSGGMTPAYCSPEQAQIAAGKQAHADAALLPQLARATDIWSWALSVLEMFVGRPFWAEDAAAGLAVGQLAPQALGSYLSGEVENPALKQMPGALAELLGRCLRPEVKERPKNLREVADHLRDIYASVTGREYPRKEPQAAELLADGLNNRALSLMDLGKGKEAEGLLDEALRAEPAHPEATFNRGLLLWRSGAMTDDVLVTQLEEVQRQRADDWHAGWLLGQVHLERGDAPAAIKVLEAALPRSGNDQEVLAALDRAKVAGRGRWGRCLRTFEGHPGIVQSVALSPDRRWGLSGSLDDTLRLWDLATGACLRTFKGHADTVSSVAIAPDGRWGLSGSEDKTLRPWDLATGACLRTFEGHTGGVNSVAISPDGRWGLSGSEDKTMRLWEFVWDYQFPSPADWDEGARPYLVNFLCLHTPYAATLPAAGAPSPEQVQLALTRRGKPAWTDADFQQLIIQLQYAGYGWLRPEGVRRELEQMLPSGKARRGRGNGKRPAQK
jgi:serine/threonine protein kinase